MLIVPKRLQALTSIGHGVLLALAAAGAVSMLGAFTGTTVSSKLLGDIFFYGSLLAAPITFYFNTGALVVAARE